MTLENMGDMMDGKKGIEYADKSWNPYHGCNGIVDGTCKVGKNCWAYRRALMLGANPQVKGYPSKDPFQPVFDSNKLDIPLKRKKPTRWDTCFMGDIADAKTEWLQQIIDVVKQCPQHRFYFLTKRPDLLAQKNISFPENAWLGVTVNSQDDVWRIEQLKEIQACHLWVSFEPLYGEIVTYLEGIDWIVIGAQSNPVIQPRKEWVTSLMEWAFAHKIPIFMKPNLFGSDHLMELPDELRMVG
ncbi:MAG: DUF5131 family protein [Candidatus Thorarchaeota archaeon]